jgi:hypothetical protein
MKITTIIGEHGRMPQLCKNSACPAAIVADDGNAYVQGYLLAASENAELTAPVGEGFVRIPLAVLKKIATQVTHL